MVEIAPLMGSAQAMWLLFMATFCVANILMAALPDIAAIEFSRFIA